MRDKVKRLLSILMTALMLVNIMPVNAMAEGILSITSNSKQAATVSARNNVYIYTKVTGDTSGLTLNGDGWYTIGVVRNVPNLPSPNSYYYPGYQSSLGSITPAKVAGGTYGAVERYALNKSIDINDISWTGVKCGFTVANGASDYSSEAPSGTYCWHLDGTVDVKNIPSVYTIKYVDADTNTTLHSEYYEGHLHDPAETHTAPSTYKKDGYTYSFFVKDGNAQTQTIDYKAETKTLTFYYHRPYTITYQKGAHGTFATQTYTAFMGAATPAFDGTPTGASGYTFKGWSPKVSGAVSGDQVYTAQWYENVTLTATSGSKKYNGEKQTLSGYTCSKDGVTFSGISAKATGTNAGTYDVTFSKTNGGNVIGTADRTGNYVVTGVKNGKFEITKRDVTITSKSAEKMYDGSELIKRELDVTGDGFVKNEGVTCIYLGTQTQVGSSENTFTWKLRDNTNAGNYNITANNGTLKVTKRDVTLTSASGTKTYDGKPLTKDEVTESGNGFVNGEGVQYDVTGTRTLPGTSSNTFTYTANLGTNLENYIITKKLGTLTVNDRDKKFEITVKAKDHTQVYTGVEYTTDQFEFENPSMEFTVEGVTYTVEGVSFVPDQSYRNVSDSGTGKLRLQGNAIVKDMQGNDVTDQFTVHLVNGDLNITPRPVRIAAKSAKKVYDGTPLTAHDYTVLTPTETLNEGFLGTEGLHNIVCSGSQTEVGSSDNTIVSYDWNDNTLAENYTISFEKGKLEVTPVTEEITVTVKGNRLAKAYNGKTQSVEGYTFVGASSPLYTENDFALKPGVEAKASGKNVKRSDTGAAETYNMGLTADSFVNTNTKTFKNVKFVVEEDGSLEIIPRLVRMTSASDSKPFDGKPLTKEEVTVDGNGFVEGEGVTYTFAGSQTEVGTSPNYFAFDPKPGTLRQNYVFQKNYGTLTVTASETEVVVRIIVNSGSKTYNGAEQSVEGYTFVRASNPLYTADYVALKPGVEAKISGTDAGTYFTDLTEDSFVNTNTATFPKVKFVVTDGTLTIYPVEIELTAKSKVRRYNGNPLTANDNEYDITKGEFVGEDGLANVTVEGSQTLPGESASTITGHTLKEGTKAQNYAISYQPGKLTVTKPLDGEKHAVVVKAQSGEKTYDGKPLTVSGILVDGVAGDTFTWNDQTFTVKGLTASKEGTNVTDSGAVKVQGTAKIVDAENNDVTEYFKVTTEDGSLTIHKVAIVLTSNSASKVYDGKPLTESGYTITSGAFVGEEGLASITMAGSQTVVGSTWNTITGYKLKSNTNRKNYDIVTKSGTLTVTPVTDQITVTIKGKRLATLYSGDEQSVEGYTASITGSDLYKEIGIFTFTGTAKASGIHAGETYMDLDPEQFTNANTNFTNVKFVVAEDGMLTIQPRLITMTSADASKPYDSKPLIAHEVTVTGDGFVKDEGADYTFTGTQTVVGKSENAFAYTRKSNTQKDDYVITKVYGTLEVTHRAEGQEYEITVRANSGSKTYDGTPLTVEGMKIDGFDGMTFTVDGIDETFTLSGLTAKETGTNVFDSTVIRIEGTEKITDSKGNDLSDSFNVTKVDGRLEITPVEIELTANSDSKPYDGQPLTNSGYKITKGAFVGEEGLASVTVEGSQTLVGTSDNVITGHTLKDNTWASNYHFKYAKGTLQVTNRDAEDKYQITVEANSGEKFYDGQKMTVEGFKTLTFFVDGQTYTVSGLTAKRVGTNVTDSGFVTISGTPIVKNVDGVDVTEQFVVSTTSGILHIKPRKVEITSLSADKEYDGTALTRRSATETPFNAERGEGFIEGEGATCTFTGSQMLVGKSDNAFTYELKKGTNQKNYEITTHFGTLEVKERAEKYEITVEANRGGKLYDGKPMTVSGFKTLSFRVDGNDYTVEGLTASHTATNCNESRTIVIQGTPIVKDAKGNIVTNQFKVHLVNGDLTIIRRQINLRSKGAEKVYDGKPLTCHEIVQTGEFAEGEGVTCTFTGTQTEVGSTFNEFDYTVNEGTDLLNYVITRQFGNLVVKASEGEVVVTITGNSGSKTYDGAEMTVEGYTFTTNNALYTQADFGLVGTAKASGKDAGTYTMGLTEKSFVNKNSETFPNVRFVVTDGSLTISPIEIELTARSASKTYDGRPLVGAVYDVTKGAFAAGEGLFIVYLRGSQLTPGTSASIITHYKFEDNTKAQNYTITTKPGTLTVISRKDDPNAEPYKITVEANSGEKFYDGKKMTVEGFKTLTFTKNVNGKDVTYTVEGITASASATDASNIVVEVKGKPIVKDAKGNDVTSEFDVTTVNGRLLIKPRTVTLTSATDSKTYDGTPLTNATVTATAYSAENGTGFAGDEGATYNVTGSQLTPGTSDNTFTYTLNNGAKAQNYTITTKPGTLTVKSRSDEDKYKITVEANSGEKFYDGKKLTVEGFKTLTFEVEGNTYTVSGLTAKRTGTNVTDSGAVTVTGKPIVTDADGNDVTDQFVVSTMSGILRIKPRGVLMASASASKPYDGNPLTAHTMTIFGFVKDEGANVTVTGSQTLVGTSDNTFTYTLRDGTKAENYDITTEFGTLTVTDRSDRDKYQITLEPNSGSKTYDGTDLTVSGFKTLTFEIAGHTYTVDNLTVSYTVRHVSQSNTFTVPRDALDAAIVRDKDGNDVTAQFKLFALDGLAIIKPRKVKLVSKSAEKPYDGTPLTRHEFEVQGDGFADGDSVLVTFSGSQTLVGESDNEFTYRQSYGTAEDRDYAIEVQFGKLKVTNRSNEDKYKITVTANSASKVYDGTPLTVSGFKTLTFDVDGNTYKVAGLTAEKSVTNVSDSGEVEITGTAIVTDAAGNDVTDQFELTLVSGRAAITPRSVTLTSADASKEYDGDPLTKHLILISGDGFIEGEGTGYLVTGSQTLVGTSDNTFTYTLHAGTKAQNYAITTEFGKLTVTDRSEEHKYPITVEANSDTKVYDGQPLEVEGFKTLTFTANGHDYTVEGLTAFASATDFVVDLPVNVQGEAIVRDADGNDVTAQFNITTKNGTLNITKRPASIRSSDAWKEYDGKPLTDHTTAITNFVEGEGAFVSVTGSQTLVGTSDNTFTYTLKDGTKAENYDITIDFGTLEVKNRTEKYKITVEANSDSKTYDGQPMTVKGFKDLIFVVEDNIYTVSGLKAEKTVTNVSESGEVEVKGTAIVKDTDGNDVTAQFTVETKNGNATITPRKVTLTSDSASREYNGKPLTNHLVFIEEDGFIEGEGARYHVTGSQTLVGSSDNTFTYTLHAGTKAENYTIETEFGKLTVTDRSEENKYKITVKGNSGEKKYDGQSMTVSGFETLTFEVEGNTYTVEGLTAEKTGKNVGDSGSVPVTGSAIVKDAGGNDVTAQFKVTVEPGNLTINPRLITLTSQGAKKEYDGTPLMNPTVVVEEDGFAAGEGATYSNFASQTRVGEKYNSFTYTLNENTLEENYLIQLKFYKLTVTDRTQKFEITVVGNSANKTYDGTPLTVSGFKNLTFTENGQTFTVEGLTAEKSITNVTEYGEVPITGTAVVKDAEGIDVTAQFTVHTVPGRLTIIPRAVIMTSATAEKAYDGTPLTHATVTETAYSAENGTGFVSGEGASYDVTGSQTLVGTSDNTFTYTLNEGTLAANYDIKTLFGKLTVTDGTDEKPLDPSLFLTKTHDATKTYDTGDKVEFTINVTNIYDSEKVVILSELPNVTILGTDTKTLAANETWTVKAVYTITWEDILRGSFTNTVTASFKEGKTWSAEDTVEAADLNPVLTVVKTSDIKANEKASLGQTINYTITVTNTGNVPATSIAVEDKLTHMTAIIQTLDIGESRTFYTRYTVTEQDVLNGSVLNVATAGGAPIVDPKDPENPKKPEGSGDETVPTTSPITIKPIDKVTLYDGTVQGGTDVELVAGTLLPGHQIHGEILGSGKDADPYQLTIGTATVTDADGNDVTHMYEITRIPGTLLIEKRKVTLTSMSATKEYDGKKLTSTYVSVTGDGFVPGEIANVFGAGGITEVGSITNPIQLVKTAAFNPDNYIITLIEGTLTVTPRTITHKKYDLTIRYVYQDGKTAAPTYHQANMPYGKTYDIASPVIKGYTPSLANVSGMITDQDILITVIYTADSLSVNLSDYGVPLGLGTFTMNVGDCFE
jgi:uncharacterized repeat protein (TIGR01451 family)